jgi:hypothetical protein
MHQMVCADDSIDRASVAAVCTTDAKALVNYGNATCDCCLFSQWQDFLAQQARQSPYGLVTARRTEIYGDAVLDNSRSVRAAPWITTLGALCLRQQVVDLLNETGCFSR